MMATGPLGLEPTTFLGLAFLIPTIAICGAILGWDRIKIWLNLQEQTGLITEHEAGSTTPKVVYTDLYGNQKEFYPYKCIIAGRDNLTNTPIVIMQDETGKEILKVDSTMSVKCENYWEGMFEPDVSIWTIQQKSETEKKLLKLAIENNNLKNEINNTEPYDVRIDKEMTRQKKHRTMLYGTMGQPFNQRFTTDRFGRRRYYDNFPQIESGGEYEGGK